MLSKGGKRTVQYSGVPAAPADPGVEAGIVALSIAGVPEITYTLIDDSLRAPLLQAIAVVDASPQPEAAREFVAFVTGPQGREILQLHGFTLPDQP